MQYQRFDPAGCNFPRPKVPVLPALSRQTLGNAKTANFKPLGSNANALSFTRGRYALTEAYRLTGIDPNSSLLAPAYHCRTLLDPAIRLGGAISLYPLRPDLAALAACLASCIKPVKAMLLTHYFGFAQALKPIAEFCAQHGITLIEDCSHALFINANTAAATPANHLPMGTTGRFGVASPYKFFASEDGGLLWANEPNEPPLTLQTLPSLKQQLKGIVNALQRGRSQAKDSLGEPRSVAPGNTALPLASYDPLEQTDATSPYNQPDQEHLQSFAISHWLMRHTNLQRLTQLRRQHDQQWANAVARLPHSKPLFPQLPADCVPYMFPLLIDHPATHFFALKQLGVPIWRWDDMAVSACQTTTKYRLKLLHLPCHQELTPEQMTWMTSTVQNVMQQPTLEHPT